MIEVDTEIVLSQNRASCPSHLECPFPKLSDASTFQYLANKIQHRPFFVYFYPHKKLFTFVYFYPHKNPHCFFIWVSFGGVDLDMEL